VFFKRPFLFVSTLLNFNTANQKWPNGQSATTLARVMGKHKSGHMARVEAISAWLKTHAIYLVISCFLFFNVKNTRAVC